MKSISLKIKMLVLITATCAVIFLPIIGVINKRNLSDTIEDTKVSCLLTAQMLKGQVQGYMAPLVEQCLVLRQYALNTWKNSDSNMPQLHSISKSMLEDHTNIMSAWTIWAPQSFKDQNGEPLSNKHIAVSYTKDFDRAVFFENPKGHSNYSYVQAIQTLQLSLTPPSIRSYYEDNSDRTLFTTISTPIMNNITVLGVVGIDAQLNPLSDLLNIEGMYHSGITMILSDNGHIVANTARKDLDMPIDRIYEHADTTLMGMIRRGEKYNDFYTSQRNNERFMLTLVPFAPVKGHTNWTLCMIIPEAEVMTTALRQNTFNMVTGLAGLALIAIISWMVGITMIKPINQLRHALDMLSEGRIDLNSKVQITSGDEIGQMLISANQLIENLDRMMTFAVEIGKGNLNAPFKKIGHNDVFGDALLRMRASLETSHEHDQIRKAEEQKERWSNDGIAQFAELLRRNYTNMEDFAHTMITHLVNYTEMNIGGLFLLNNDNAQNTFFELTGCFAYDGLKFEQKRIMLGEGLVGRCAKEAETIMITDLPKGYIKIATGLGYDDPTCLLLVPMKHNDEVLGVIEMASFEQIEPYRVNFVERIGTNMASTISNIKVNVHTNQLLEESRVKSEELASQEEEMRQNMEELQATQEEAARKRFEMESLISALNASSIVMEYDLDGHVLAVNKAYLDLAHLSEHDVLGTHHADNIVFTDEQKQNYHQFWDDLSRGLVRRTVNKLILNNVERTFIESYSPIMGSDGMVLRIFKLAHNIDDFALPRR